MSSSTTFTRLAVLFATIVVLAAPGRAWAQKDEWQWRARALAVIPQDDCEPITDTGTVFTLNTTAGLGYELTYGLTRTLALDLSVAVSWHDLRTSGGTVGGLDAGTVWLAPVLFTLQYRPALLGHWHPYVGLGAGYGLLFGYAIDSEVEAHELEDLELDGSAGVAAQAGVLYDLSETSFVSFDVAYLQLANEITLIAGGGRTYDVVDMDVDPWQVGLAFGYRF